jgi:hypothetical protein
MGFDGQTDGQILAELRRQRSYVDRALQELARRANEQPENESHDEY